MQTFPYENPVDPESVHVNPVKLADLAARFQKGASSGSFPGGQLVLRREAKLVHCQAVGVARGFRESESGPALRVKPQTPFPLLSVGKPLAAVAIAMLEDRGLLDVEAPIAEIFPDFARHGKEQITTLDVLTHRSGIRMPEFVKDVAAWGNRKAVQQALIETVPVYSRGTLAYQPYEYGWILSEIMQRVDGRNLPDFFAAEIAAPLQLPALQFGLAGRDLNSLAFSYWLGKGKVIVAGMNVAEDFEEQNSARFLNARNPATSLVSDAASVAAFYDFLLNDGSTPSGQNLVSRETLRRYTTHNYFSWDRSMNVPLTMGRGFILGTRFPSNYGWWNTNRCFGLGGGFSSLAFGDYETNASIAIVTNGNKSLVDQMRRFLPFAHGLRKACMK